MPINNRDRTPVLSRKINEILTSMSRSRSVASGLSNRARLVLLASDGMSDRDIAIKIGLHYNNVGIWRNRFLEILPLLSLLESEAPEALEEEINQALSDRYRSGAPSVYTQEQIVKIIDLACTLPSDHGIEASQWSLSELAREAVRQKIVPTMSAKSVWRFLKSDRDKASSHPVLAQLAGQKRRQGIL